MKVTRDRLYNRNPDPDDSGEAFEPFETLYCICGNEVGRVRSSKSLRPQSPCMCDWPADDDGDDHLEHGGHVYSVDRL